MKCYNDCVERGRACKSGFMQVKKRRFAMDKYRLAEEVSRRTKVTQKKARQIIDIMMDIIEQKVGAGERVVLVGFGAFESRKRAPRTGRNPRTGAAVKIPARTVPAFAPGKHFKALVKKL